MLNSHPRLTHTRTPESDKGHAVTLTHTYLEDRQSRGSANGIVNVYVNVFRNVLGLQQ